MHELSIAVNVVDTVVDYAKSNNAKIVHYIELDIGTLSGVVVEALDFAMTEAVKGSICENAEVKINEISAVAICNSCNNQFDVDDLYSVCPKCDSFDNRLIKGKELNLKKILV